MGKITAKARQAVGRVKGTGRKTEVKAKKGGRRAARKADRAV